MKQCSTCKKWKPVSEFHKRRASPDGLSYICKKCSKERQQLYYLQHGDKVRAQHKQSDATIKARAIAIQDKVACFEAYGGARCAVCGETSLDALSLDHINDDGAEHRKRTGKSGIHMYRLLKSQGYPDQSRYQSFVVTATSFGSERDDKLPHL